jgi:hypothetical protein
VASSLAFLAYFVYFTKVRKQKKSNFENGLETMSAKYWTFEDLVLKLNPEYSELADVPDTVYAKPMEMQTFGPQIVQPQIRLSNPKNHLLFLALFLA